MDNAVVEFLKENNWSSFYASLLAQYERKGSLSERQLECVKKGMEKAKAKLNPPPLSEQAVPAIIEFINRNNAAKYPAIRFLVASALVDGRDVEHKLTKASERASVPGSLNIIRLTDRAWLGRIHPNGQVELREDNQLVVAAIRAIAEDPEAVAREYGRKTGHCCFCGLLLDDERSLLMGYGPVCAKKYRLAWGERPIAEAS